MAMKRLLEHTLLLKIYKFQRILNQHKNDGMVNNWSKVITSSNFKKSTNATKQHCFQFQSHLLVQLLKLKL